MDVSASSMCDSTTTSFQLVNNDDNCVIVQSAEHALHTSLSLRTSRIVDGRTQCMYSACRTECGRRECI